MARRAPSVDLIADLLPNELAGDIRAMIEQAARVMKPTLERE